MGSRSRKRRQGPAQAPPPPRVRGEARNEQIRAGLEPLAPGERPRALVVAAILAGLMGAGNLVLVAAGYDIRGSRGSSTAGSILLGVVLLIMALGIWQKRYWAVLGFQCLLAVIGIGSAVSAPFSENLQAVVLCVVLVGVTAPLFWFLVRVLARIQMPERPGRVNRHG